MPDVYASIVDADTDLQAQLADVLELRAADPRQREMLAEYTAASTCPTAPRCWRSAAAPGRSAAT